MSSSHGVLRIVALDSAHKDPDFFEYPESLPDQAAEPVWGVWEHDGSDWTEKASGLTVAEAENER